MKRLRAQLGPDGYQVVRSNDAWPDHKARTLVTASAIAWCRPDTVIDPACGDASIVSAAHRLWPIRKAYLSDISLPQIAHLWGMDLGYDASLAPGDAFEVLDGLPKVDVIVLTEILEHIEDPGALLALARTKAARVVASSPLDEDPGRGNHEHVWSFSKEDYRGLLEAAGWNPVAYHELSFFPPYYTFQLWVAE